MSYYTCSICGTEFDSSNEFEMAQVEGHLDRHQEAK